MAKAELKGRRVVLRPLRDEDAGELFEAVEAGRDALKRRLGWASAALKPEDERRFIAESARGAESGERFVWGVFDARSGKLAGVAALRGMADRERSQARIGMWIVPARHDRGLGTEAAKLVADHGFRKLGLHRIYARLDPANRAYRRVLKKAGFRYEGCLRADKRLNGRWIDQECWGVLRSETKK